MLQRTACCFQAFNDVLVHAKIDLDVFHIISRKYKCILEKGMQRRKLAGYCMDMRNADAIIVSKQQRDRVDSPGTSGSLQTKQ